MEENQQQNNEPEVNVSGRATSEEIARWKAEHGKVHEIIVDDKACYLKPIDLPTLRLANSHLKTDATKFAQTIAENAWISGDKGIYTDAEYIMIFADRVSRIINDKMSYYAKH